MRKFEIIESFECYIHTYIQKNLFKHASLSNKMLISRGGGGGRVTKYIENIYNDILDLRQRFKNFGDLMSNKPFKGTQGMACFA